MNKIGIVVRPGHADAAQLALAIVEHFREHTFLLEEALAQTLGRKGVPSEELGRDAELLVALGGDGTLLYAARLLGDRSVPVLGIHRGSLGFMTETPRERAFEAIDDVLSGRAHIDSRMKLHAELLRGDEVIFAREVLNDVVINKGVLTRMSTHDVWLDEIFVASYQADGIIFATPTGSTAYSLSAGGPIVHPAVDCVVVTPICPHSLTQRPLIVPGDQRIQARLAGDASDVFLSVDGQASLPLHPGDEVRVRKSKHRLLIVRNARLDYFSILRQKLRWGERGAA